MARVTFYLGSRPYPFCLDVPGVMEIESLTGFGLWMLETRLLSGAATAKEVQAAFRLGLAGAGVPEPEVLELTALHVVVGRMDKARAIALAVISDALRGISDAEADLDRPAASPGKPAGGAVPPSAPSTTDASTGPESSAGSRTKASRPRPSKAPKSAP